MQVLYTAESINSLLQVSTYVCILVLQWDGANEAAQAGMLWSQVGQEGHACQQFFV